MGFDFQGATTTTTLAGNIGIPLPSADQTFVSENYTGAGSKATAYTPTAGKIFYLFGVSTPNNGSGVIYDNDGTTAIGFCIASASAHQDFPNGGNGMPVASYTNAAPLEINGTNGANFHIWGIEVDA